MNPQTPKTKELSRALYFACAHRGASDKFRGLDFKVWGMEGRSLCLGFVCAAMLNLSRSLKSLDPPSAPRYALEPALDSYPYGRHLEIPMRSFASVGVCLIYHQK